MYGNTNSRAKIRRGVSCPAYSFYFNRETTNAPTIQIPFVGSLLFNGGDYLIPNSAISLSAGNFTIEWWQKWIVSPPTQSTYMFGAYPSNNQFLLTQNSPNQWQWQVYSINGPTTIDFSTSQTTNNWYHMVFSVGAVYYGNKYDYTMFQNGIRSSSGVQSYTDSFDTGPSDFAASAVSSLISPLFKGYISNFRIITGTNIYNPNLTTIVLPSNPLSKVATNTTYLLNMLFPSPSLLSKATLLTDNSSNGITTYATEGDSTIATPENPFSISPVRTNYKSIVFPTNTYFIMNPGIVFGSNTTPFTIKVWIYCAKNPTGNYCILGSGGLGADGTDPYPNYGLSVANTDSTTWRIDSSGIASQPFTLMSMAANNWYFLVVARDSNSYVQMWMGTTGYANASTTGPVLLNSNNWNLTTPTLLVGAWTNTGLYNDGLIINDIQVTNTNTYTITDSQILIPTTKLGLDNGTTLLMNSGDFVDSSGTQTLTVVGQPSNSYLSPL